MGDRKRESQITKQKPPGEKKTGARKSKLCKCGAQKGPKFGETHFSDFATKVLGRNVAARTLPDVGSALLHFLGCLFFLGSGLLAGTCSRHMMILGALGTSRRLLTWSLSRRRPKASLC